MNKIFFLILSLSIALPACAASKKNPRKVAASEFELDQTTKSELIIDDLYIPWSIEFLDKDTLIFSQKDGVLKTLHIPNKNLTDILGGPKSSEHGQGGLLDIALHPQFATNKILYFAYTKKVGSQYTTAIANGKLNTDLSKIENLKDIFVANNASSAGVHFGSRITFDENGHLYFGVGDRGNIDLAQDLSAAQGKIHRLKLNGETPTDNPFYNTDGALKTIWSLGHRNPQGLVFDPVTKKLYESEHGPQGGDEINIIQRGRNYGWPIITYGEEYGGGMIGEGTAKEGLEQPLHYYKPSIAPCGLEIYNHTLYRDWRGQLFSGALVQMHLNRITISNPQEIKETRILTDDFQRIRDVKQSPDGKIYLATDAGKILRLVR